ncbi:hypothetical protein CJ030_MR3G001089 [Morella rubra]|uniref:Uncharacterized protein n=1 Tax=Morella rubra TaxID=262757 RepID=A0A6A1W6V8_9ROSI|nr:hypothetical protein CJ030_MR3G001089 [Morella rubra]
MNSRKNVTILLIIFVIHVAVLNHVGVEATRVLSEDFVSANHLETHDSSIYEQAKHTMGYWLQQLPLTMEFERSITNVGDRQSDQLGRTLFSGVEGEYSGDSGADAFVVHGAPMPLDRSGDQTCSNG